MEVTGDLERRGQQRAGVKVELEWNQRGGREARRLDKSSGRLSAKKRREMQ
jgi:hypothetical protein